ncbi:MAG: Na(+)-translocating NADH-quinone reductase subunit C [Bacteriovoracaceae bacterium]|jgi:Na+-transporting NADH:ubiquinone oxidoreductase subunit C|nr:Na(+)-translocating NADH-quinone reductase subunit C [Bacteriovoracaceae bacterium]
MAKSESMKTITVSAALCIVCSILVSVTVVSLRPMQKKNADLDYKKNILNAAGLLKAGDDIEKVFSKVETVLVDFETGKIIEGDAKSYDQNKAATDPANNVKIPADKDIAGLGIRAKVAKVFLTRSADGKPDVIVLNVRSMGLWSTMYGFLALEADTKTVKGFAYYSQGETPGLGGEVDNPKWKSQWIGKSIYDEDFNVAFDVLKGSVDKSSKMAKYQVDGLSGATITGVGVGTSIKYWFGNDAYGKFLANVRAGEI